MHNNNKKIENLHVSPIDKLIHNRIGVFMYIFHFTNYNQQALIICTTNI